MGQSQSNPIDEGESSQDTMARLGRDDGTVSFPSSPTPVRRNRKGNTTMGTSPNASTKHRNSTEVTKPTSNNCSTPKSKPIPSTKPVNLSDPAPAPAEDNNNREPPSSARSTGDLYTPLLTYICEHTFMRKKQYPIPRSSRIQFVRDVNTEGKVLGYEQAVIDRVLLDIKRYYLVNVGWGHAFTEGVEFGDEIDDSRLSGVSGDSKDRTAPKEKLEATLSLDAEASKKRNSTKEAGLAGARTTFCHYGLDPYALDDVIDDAFLSFRRPKVSTVPRDKKLPKHKQAAGPPLSTEASTRKLSGGNATFSGSVALKSRDYLDRFDLNDFLRDDVDNAKASKPQEPQEEKKKRKRCSSTAPAQSKTSSGAHKKASKGSKSDADTKKSKKSTVSVKSEEQEHSRSRPKKKRQRAKSVQPSQRAASKSNTDDLPELTAGDEVRSKYFAHSPTKGGLKRESVEAEASRKTAKTQPLDLDSDFDNRSRSPDRSPQKAHIPDDDPDGTANASAELSQPEQCPLEQDFRTQTPLQLDLPLNKPVVIEEKKPRLKPTKKSPYFQGPLVHDDSCLPFPPIDAPSFGLVQEQLAHDPFRLLLATIFLNRTRGGVALPVLFQVFDRYPTIEAMASADPEELTAMINCLGFQNQRARKCIALAQTWLASPPTRDRRYRKLSYPCKSDGRDIKPAECITDDDPRVAWEIAHLPGAGAYALDSWRVFCRDELRGLAEDWQGNGAETEEFTPEWKSVLPMDKELRAYLTWMWLKEGWVWERETGNRTRASEKVMRAARRGATAHIEKGNWVLETSPVKHRNRDPSRKLSSSSSTSLKSKHKAHRSSSQKQSHLPPTKDRDREADPDPDPDEPPLRASTPASAPKSRKQSQRRSSMPGLDSASRSQTASFLESRTSLPYPTFSKAHSREAVGKPGVPTPDPTDLTEHKTQRPDSRNAPPSPPLTSTDQHSRKGSTVDDKGDKVAEKVTELNRSSSSLRAKKEKDDSSKASKSTVRADTPKSKRSSHSKDKDRDTPSRSASHKPSKSKLDHERKRTPPPRDVGSGSANGSDATIAAPRHSPSSRVKSPEKPPSRTQMRSSASNRPSSVNHHRTPFDTAMDYGRPPTFGSTYGTPPPPPPPPDVPVANPRVDYLLRNGGLDYQVPKSLLLNTVFGDQPQVQPHLAASRVFEPFSRLLDDYQSVVNKNGSLAVATGSRSVARRLLDRLEAVFARDISSEACRCLMCEHEDYEELPSGVSWGEVLELVSGRRELPSWPPFILTTELNGADLSGDEHIPMQKMDIDVPEEYREHFLRQSRKTKTAVDKWLAEQVEQPTSAPEEVDDETLTFAMLTHLATEQRSIFRALLGITSTSTPRPDGGPRDRPEALVSSSYAIQRLYRLSSRPRDPETAMYMLNNPGIHHVLATLAAISDDEWDILVSGRFDGFLRSGAEDSNRYSASRSNTPFSATGGRMSRGPTTPSPLDRPMSQPMNPSSPGSFGGPIALDEEMEIAALAEVEREIYAGMEALEDAFEALHMKAETVRLALRERGAGLSIANQNRRGTFVEARLGTPASAYPWESGTDDDFLDDAMSLAPDDSASNISSNRRRRPKRRTERRTPAPVEEEDEGEEDVVGRRDSRNSRRR
ncbi:hypothetical protein BDV06DRAFT_231568 [Aspergillus oleicola]